MAYLNESNIELADINFFVEHISMRGGNNSSAEQASIFPYRLDVEEDNGNRSPMKAMVISIDKFTAVRMYEKVQYHLKEEVKELRKKMVAERDPETKKRYETCCSIYQ